MVNDKRENRYIVIMSIASSFLLIYSVARIADTLSGIFISHQMYSYTAFQKLDFIFTIFVSYMDYVVLALCGSVLIYTAYFIKDKTSAPKPAKRAKNVIFSLLLVLSVISAIHVVYNTVLVSGAGIRIIDNIAYLAIGLLTYTGVALFAILILRKIWNNSFRNVVVALYIAGTAGALLMRTISFTNTMIHYIGIRDQFEMFGITQSIIFDGIWKYLLHLVIYAAALSIVIFGLKIAEQQNRSICTVESVSE